MAASRSRLALAGLNCPRCGYDLRGLTGPTCPECGEHFDPAAIGARRSPGWLLTLAITLLILYAPFGWLLFVQSDSTYVRHWLLMWPILPGLVPLGLVLAIFGKAPGHLPDVWTYGLMGVLTLCAIVGVSWLASRSRLCFFITIVVALAMSIANAWIAYALFRM